MDPREQLDDALAALQALLGGFQAGLWTAMPVIIESYDAAKQTVVAQPAIQAVQTDQNGVETAVNIQLLLDCPVFFPGGGGATLTFPIAKGDEGLAVFSSRCIDAWWQSGGVQPQAARRQHALSDAIVFVGLRSQPRKLSSVSTTSTQLRSDDGSTLIGMNPTAQTLTLTAPGGATINANVTINGDLHVTGTVTGDTDVVGGGKSLKGHKHTGVQTGSGISGGPQ